MEEKKQEVEIDKKQSKFLLWIANFWYHYKWHTIVALFFAFTLTFCFVQCAKREEPDLLLVFAGDVAFPDEGARDALVEAISANAPGGERSNERMKIQFVQHTIFSPEQMQALSVDEEGDFSPAMFSMLQSSSQNEYDAFSSFRMTGECSLYFVSDYVYENSGIKKQAVPLSELFETIPQTAADAYSIRFSDTAFYHYYAASHVLPEDFRVVLMRPLVIGASSDKEVYEAFKALFLRLVTFEAP